MSTLIFHPTMDDSAMDVLIEDKSKAHFWNQVRLGSIQWHKGSEPRFVPATAQQLTLSELDAITSKLRECIKRSLETRIGL